MNKGWAGARETLRTVWQRWVGTAACVATAVLSAVVAAWIGARSQQTSLGQAIDENAMDAVARSDAGLARMVGLLGTISIVSIAVALVALIAVAAVRKRYAAAVAAVVLVVGANVTTQVFKRVLDRSDFANLTVHSFPSGHTTVVVSVVLAALLVAPRAARPLVSLVGSGVITVVAAATIMAGWHRPSDVIGATLVALAWGSAVVALWGLAHGGVPLPPPGAHRLFAIVGVVLGSVLLVVAGMRPGSGWSGFLDASVVLFVLGLVSGLTVTVFAHLSSATAEAEVTNTDLRRIWQTRATEDSLPPVGIENWPWDEDDRPEPRTGPGAG